MRKQLRADAAMAGTILLLGAVLALTGSALLQRWFSGSGFLHPPRFEEAIGAVSAAVGFAVVIWWLLSFVLAVLAGVLQRTGHREAADAMGRLAPTFMRRLVLLLLGVNLLCTPLAHAADEPINPLWQPSVSTIVPTPAPASAPVFRQSGRTSSEPNPLGEPVSPLWQPQAPIITPGLLAPAPSRSPSGFAPLLDQQGAAAGSQPGSAQVPDAAEDHKAVVVKAGDTLWTLAAQQLGPLATDAEVARQWPAWFRINRSIIGPDPSLILPGQILRAP
ncbi:hypothetical protein IV500_08565 [Paeniglutamicibacter antarcticus]|uniref:LysM domain-containing protein n=1 Tax=Arthrobacter terrae TaxID=2935737 RepID=A0A931G7L7_9MICC|nr:hypothetical protein [Arthrobacter terrae]MBG0739439.1 hypothetical protein [Arthrobacter terrae]